MSGEQQAIDATLADRGKQYGPMKEFSDCSQAFKKMAASNYSKLSNTQRECLDMIFHKIARILEGNPNLADSWHDIAGYARLAEKEIIKLEQEKPNQFLNGRP